MLDEQTRQRAFLEIAHEAVILQASNILAEDVEAGEGFVRAHRYSGTGAFIDGGTILHAAMHLPADMSLQKALADLIDHLDDKIRTPIWYARDLGVMRPVKHPLPKSELFFWHIRHTVVAAFNYGRIEVDGEDKVRDFSPSAMSALLAQAARAARAIPDSLSNEDAAGDFCEASGLRGIRVKKYPKWIRDALA